MKQKPMRILLVDDSRDDRALAKAALLKGSSRSFEFLEAETAGQGLNLLNGDEQQWPDCILLDYDLPDMEAPDFLAALPREKEIIRIPVIVLTGTSMGKNLVALRAGAHEYLGKNWMTPESLTRSIENAIERQTMATELRERTSQLRDSEEFNRLIFNSSPDCLKILNLDGTLVEMNTSGMRLMEIEDFSCFKRLSWTNCWPENLRGDVERAIQSAREGETGYFQGLCPTAKGTVKWWDVIVTPIRNAQGEITRLLSVSRDITQRKKFEEELRTSEENLRQLAQTIPAMITVMKTDGTPEFRNQRWYDYTGLSEEASRVSTPPEVIHPDSRERLREEWKRALAEQIPFSAETRLRRHDGEYRWFLTRVLPVRNKDGKVFRWYATHTDFEETKRAQIALEAANAQLDRQTQTLEQNVQERTAKLQEMIGELESVSYTLSHDMRQPLRSMHQFCQILAEDHGPSLDSQAQGYLERIITASNRLDRMIQDVLTYSRISRAQIVRTKVDLQRLVTDIVEQYPNLRHNVDVIMRGQLAPVLATEAPLTQIISNLLGNAVKFVPNGSRPRIEVWTESHGDCVRLCIKDNGIGIAAENLQRIWKMFERINSDKDYDGTGIGLSIVKKAAERMDGSVGVESNLGEGSLFWVQLPKA